MFDKERQIYGASAADGASESVASGYPIKGNVVAANQNKTKKPEKTALVVIGMHRSGTSAATRALSTLGADLPKNLMPPTRDNPEGYWEPINLVKLHIQMLGAVGMNWHDVSPVPAFWQSEKFIRPFREKIIEIIRRDYGDSDFFIIKDPRISRFVPVTASAIAELGATPKFIICIRNPLEVAASLNVRDGFHLSKSLTLWLDHTLRAERETRKFSRAFVFYDEIVKDWRSVLHSVAVDLALKIPEFTAKKEEESGELIVSKAYRNHENSLSDLNENDEVSQWVKATYAAIRILAKGESGYESRKKLGRIYTEFCIGQKTFGPLLKQEKASAQRLTAELEKARSGAIKYAEEEKVLSGELESARLECATLRKQFTALNEERDKAKADAAKRIEEARRLTQELQDAQAESATLRKQFTALKEERDKAKADTAKRIEESERLTQELENAQAECATLRKQVTAANEARERAKADTDKRIEESRRLAQESEAAQAQCAILRKQITAANEERDSAKADAAKHAENSRRFHEELKNAHDQLVTQNNMIQEHKDSPSGRITPPRRAAPHVLPQLKHSFQATRELVNISFTSGPRAAYRLYIERRAILSSGAFDRSFYVDRNPDVIEAGVDPVLHFIQYGWHEQRDPASTFSVSGYLAAYPDVREAGCNPLLHFIEYGKAEGRSPLGAPDIADQDGRSARTQTERVSPSAKPIARRETVKSTRRSSRVLEDLNGNVVEVDPLPAFGSKEYELIPTISGPVLMLPLNESQFPVSLIEELRVAVHLHLHHIDLADEFASYLSNIPLPFRLMISLTDADCAERIYTLFSETCPRAAVEVRSVQNRGRDIASLVSEFAESLRESDIIAHFHSKRSLHNPAKVDWRRQLLHSLLGSEDLIRNIFSLFRFNPHLGMVFPEYHWSLEKQISWGRNFEVCEDLATRTGLSIDKARLTLFPAGSMFWARAKALDALIGAEFDMKEFPPEEGQVDGTLAHAIERMLGEYVRQAGFDLHQIKPDRQHSLSRYYTADWPYARVAAPDEDRRIAAYSSENKARRNRVAVYTAIAGGYDVPLVHETLDPEIDYYLFTDQPVPDMGFWRVRSIDYYHPDPVRRARYVKTHPHVLLPEYDLAIWVDSNVLIRGDLLAILRQGTCGSEACIFGIEHPHRQCMYEEARILIEMGKDSAKTIERQIQTYRDAGFPENLGLVETNLLAADLRNPATADLFRTWWGELVKFSRRDQLSINYALWSRGHRFSSLLHEGHSLRSHPAFAYFAHGSSSGWPSRTNDEQRVEPVTIHPIAKASDNLARKGRPAVDVIVCVHNALDDVRACLASVLQAREAGDRVIIVDDASGSETAQYLEEFARDHSSTVLIRNGGAAHGYCRSANTGLRATQAPYSLLLNSDAVLPPGALNKMTAAAESGGDVAVVGPLSNAASTQSVPRIKGTAEQTAVNALPRGMSVYDMDKWCERTCADAAYARVPLVHGFCQLIRTDVLATLGYFDEVAFPYGYGEENDFCFRVAGAGYELLIAIDTFVFHRKSASYSDINRRKRLMAEGSHQLRLRYGRERLSNAITAMEEHPVLRRVRKMAAESLFTEEVVQ